MITFPDFVMNDGSILFASVTGDLSWENLLLHLEEMPGLTIMRTLTDDITEQWIDFRFRGRDFMIHQTFGEHWLFSNDPACPGEILSELRGHLLKLGPSA